MFCFVNIGVPNSASSLSLPTFNTYYYEKAYPNDCLHSSALANVGISIVLMGLGNHPPWDSPNPRAECFEPVSN